MEERSDLRFKTLELFTIIILYYIVGSNGFFLYVLSLSLYNIFVACFKHITLRDSLSKVNSIGIKRKIFKGLLLYVCVFSLLFLLLSVIISDIISISLNINNILFIFIMMGLTIALDPIVKILSEYLENITGNYKYRKIINIYYILCNFFVLLIALLFFRIIKIDNYLAQSFIYLAKIISFIIVILIIKIVYSEKQIASLNVSESFDYRNEVKSILLKDSFKSVVLVVKNSYYYFSIIILYLVLSTRYGYAIELLEKNITFIYFYSLKIVNYLIYLARNMNQKLPKSMTVINRLYNNFKMMLSIAIIFGIITPLTCRVIFNDSTYAIYLMMTNCMAIFILLYDLTYENIKRKEIIYISLVFGFLLKVITIIPLINAFYRMGYNLVYGDIISTCLGMILSIVINYIYLKKNTKAKEKYFEKLLDILYENILLCIILIVIEFIVPIDASNYFKSLGLIVIYLAISILFLIIKNKKRG